MDAPTRSYRVLLVIPLIILAAAVVTTSGRADAAVGAQPAEKRIVLRLAHGNTAPSVRGVSAELFSKRVNALTSGQVNVQVFGDSRIATEGQAIEGMQVGTIDMGVITLYSTVVTAGMVFDLPYVFRDYEHWAKAVDGAPGRMVAETAPEKGLRILGYWWAGYRDVYGSKPIKTPADIKGVKIRTHTMAPLVELFKALGSIPTPLPWPEVYLALQQKTVDAAEATVEALFDAKHYEVAKQISLTDHTVATTPLLISESKWNTLPQSVQQAMITAAREATVYNREQFRKANDEIEKVLVQKGCVITRPDTTPFQAMVKTQVRSKLITNPLQERILAEVEKVQ